MATQVAGMTGAMVQSKYRYISADSHLEMPTDTCAHWVPKKYQE